MRQPAIHLLCLVAIFVLNVLPLNVKGHAGHHSEKNDDGDQCPANRGCFMHTKCKSFDSNSCIFGVEWDAGDDSIKFRLRAISDTYVALGFSTSGGMTSSEVYSCGTSNLSSILRGWNIPNGKENVARKIIPGTLSKEKITVVDGSIICEFVRIRKLDNSSIPEFLDLSPKKLYTVIVAWNGELQDNGHPGYHFDNMAKSATELSFDEKGPVEEEGEFLPKLHGVLMTIAWMGFAAVGITSSRYFKPIWPQSTLCGKPVWFAIHRACMVSALICFVVAAVVIVIHIQGFILPSEGIICFLHALFGSIAIFLGLVNWVMALFRPHPGTPLRQVYNWAHWSVGTLAFVLALTTILLGLVEIDEMCSLLGGIPQAVFVIAIIFIVFHIIIWSVLQYISFVVESQGRENDIPLVNDDSGEAESIPINGGIATSTDEYEDALHLPLQVELKQTTLKGARLKQLLFWVYLSGVIISVVIVVIGIIIADEGENSI